MIKTLFTPIIVLMLCLIGIADARPVIPNQRPNTIDYKVSFILQVVDDSGTHYYNTNLDQDIAITLPVEAVKHNWSCVRRMKLESPNGWQESSGFYCTNDKDHHSITVSCRIAKRSPDEKPDEDSNWMVLEWENKHTTEFFAECLSRPIN